MRKTLPLVGALVCLASSGAGAQQAVAHAPDGGTQERIQSIAIPAIPNAPFRAVVTTVWTRIMPDGSTLTLKNHRTVARDSSGRVFEERRFFTPNGDKQETMLQEIDIEDPNQHEMHVCWPVRRMCETMPFSGASLANEQQRAPLPKGMGATTEESLGQKMVDGLELTGSREVTTINPGAVGNEKAQPVVKEFWYSPQLEINVITDRFDPRVSAEQKFVVSGISLSEPDAAMFALPEGYRIVALSPQ